MGKEMKKLDAFLGFIIVLAALLIWPFYCVYKMYRKYRAGDLL